MKFFSFLGNLLDRLCMIAGAFIGSQIPQFMQQYTQQLAARLQELAYLLEKLRQMASQSDRSLKEYIHKFLSSSDPDFYGQGEFMQQMLTRWETLTLSYQDLSESSVWTRPFVFMKELHQDLLLSTWESFKPGISLTVEGLCYVIVGALIGFLFYQMCFRVIELMHFYLFERAKPK